MTMDQVSRWPVDIEALLAPITADQPAGVSLRYEDTYDQIKEARRADDPSLPQGVWETELKRADWRAVNDLCVAALATRSKDLQIAAWLLEAWIHLHGLSGVQRGVTLLAELCRRFWPTLYPELQGRDGTARTAPVQWINEHAVLALKHIPITQPGSHEVPACTWLDWENALHLDGRAQKNPGLLKTAEAEKRITKARFRESLLLTPTAFLATEVDEIDAILHVHNDFDTFLGAQGGKHAPSLAQFKGALVNIRQLLAGALAERHADGAGDPVELDVAQEGGEESFRKTPVRSRAEAYQQLAAISDYLLAVEPHSPTPYLIRRAVSWGSMSLTDLLLELISSPGDRRAIYDLLGIKPQGD
jgi:type VI secretion system protein ImpA